MLFWSGFHLGVGVSQLTSFTVCSNRASRSCLIVCFCGWSYEATVAIATGIYNWLSVFWCCVKGRPFLVSLTVLGKPGTEQAFVSFSRTKPKNRWQECAMAKCTKRKVDNRILRQVKPSTKTRNTWIAYRLKVKWNCVTSRKSVRKL